MQGEGARLCLIGTLAVPKQGVHGIDASYNHLSPDLPDTP